MAQPIWVEIVHPSTGLKARCQESVFAGEGGLRDRGWILVEDLPPKPSPPKKKTPDKVKEQSDDG